MKQFAASSRQYIAALAALFLLMVALNGAVVRGQEITPEPQPPTDFPTATETSTPTLLPSETPIPTEMATATPTLDVSPENTAEVTPEVTVTPSPEVTSAIIPTSIIPTEPLPVATAPSNRFSVIVQLNMNAPLPDLRAGDAQAVAAAEMQVQMAQDALSASLLPFDAQVARDYDLLPLLALEVDAAGLAYLQSSPQVAAVRLNERRSLALDIATEVIGAAGSGGAWDQGYTGSGVTVAILDTGTAANHPFLGGGVVAEACFSTNLWDAHSNCPNGTNRQYGTGAASPTGCIANMGGDPQDHCEHGTHVAGIAAGIDSGVGFNGVAPGALIIAVNVFSKVDDCELYIPGWQPCLLALDWDILAGLDYVYQLSLSTSPSYNIAAVNLSLGGGLFSSYCDGLFSDYYAAVNRLRAQRVITVVAAGNEYSPTAISTPACLSNVVSVGSMDDHDTVNTSGDSFSDFGNRAPIMTLLAPGEDILSSYYDNGSYGYASISGTSMAAPMVTGALAVLRERAPLASVEGLINAVAHTGPVMVDPATGIGYHRLSLPDALEYGLFNLTSPNVASTVPGLRPTFSWEPALNAQWYEVVVANSVGVAVYDQWFQVGASALTCTPSTCSVQIPSSLPGGAGAQTFYWYVRASTGSTSGYGAGYFMGPLVFNVLPLTQNGPNNIVSDSDGMPDFTWGERVGATYYRIYVAAGSSGAMLVDEWMTSAVCTGGTCTYEPTAALPSNGVYNWFVQGYGPNGYVPWTNAMSFTLATPPPANPPQVAPSNGATLTSNAVQFEWAKVTGATYYELYVSTATTMLHQKWYALSELTPNGDNYRVTVPITGTGGLTWYVRAYGPGGLSTGGYMNSGWTGPITFTISSVSAPTGLVDDQASAGSRGDLTYTWNHNTRNEWYELYIATTGGTTQHLQWYQASALGCAATCSVHPGVSLTNGSYGWYVHGWSSTAGYTTGGPFNNGWNSASITINLSAPDADDFDVLGAFTVELGVVPIMTDSPTFEWNDIPNAMWYELYVVNQFGAVVHDVWYSRLAGSICGGGTCMVKPANLYLTNGTYTWYVHAWGPGGLSTGGYSNSGWAVPPTFQINMNASIITTTPILGTVINTTTSKPNFRWTAVAGATWYQLAVINTTTGAMAFQQWIHFDSLAIDCPATCTWSQPVELANGAYTWYVQAYGPGGISPWGGPGNFSVAVPVPGAATLNAPANGITSLVNSLAFSWTPASNATYYNLQVRKGATMIVNTWYSSAQASCSATCSVSATLAGGDYEWQIFTYGPGTVGATYIPSAIRNLTVLD